MKTSEVIAELERLLDREGDKEFHVYNQTSDDVFTPYGIYYDDAIDDIYIEIKNE